MRFRLTFDRQACSKFVLNLILAPHIKLQMILLSEKSSFHSLQTRQMEATENNSVRLNIFSNISNGIYANELSCKQNKSESSKKNSKLFPKMCLRSILSDFQCTEFM